MLRASGDFIPWVPIKTAPKAPDEKGFTQKNSGYVTANIR